MADAPVIQQLREAILAQLEGCSGRAAGMLRLRVGCSYDTATLWHLRPRLLEALAVERGEGPARQAVALVDAVFRQHWPEAPVPRGPQVH